MKLLSIILPILFIFTQVSFAQDVKEVAKEMLTAYKNKDVKGVKKYAPPIILGAISPKYFEDRVVKDEVKALKDWDGKIREVRYSANPFAVMATVYYDESAKKGKIKIFYFSKAKNNWKQFGNGFGEMKKSKFLKEGSTRMPKRKKRKAAIKSKKKGRESAESTEAAEGPAASLKKAFSMFGFSKKHKKKKLKGDKAANKGYSIEMASGDIFKNPSVKKLKKSVKSLNDDNFFLTINGPDGFIQGAYSKKKIDMQYKDTEDHFTCKEMVSKKTATFMFSEYLKGKKDWKEKCDWKVVE